MYIDYIFAYGYRHRFRFDCYSIKNINNCVFMHLTFLITIIKKNSTYFFICFSAYVNSREVIKSLKYKTVKC